MQIERVVELNFGGQSAGSGYLLTGRHAVTARHVLEPRAKGSRCTVAPLHGSTLSGTAAWLSEDHDLAIVEADQPGWPDLQGGPETYGMAPWDPIGPCVGRGFPVAAGTSDHPITATLKRIARSQKPTINVEVHPPHPRKPEWWVGISGSVIFYTNLPVAVMGQSTLNFNGLLTATPIELLFADDTFQKYWKEQGLVLFEGRTTTPLASNVLNEIASNLFWLNRELQTSDVMEHVRTLRTGGQCLPQIIAVPGYDHDEHAHFILQLARNRELRRFLENEGRPQDVIRPLPWPARPTRIDATAEFMSILTQLHSDLALPEPTADQKPDAKALRTALDQSRAPRAFVVYVRQAIALGGYADLLRHLVQLWGELGPGVPALLFLCLALDDPQPPPRKSSILGMFGKKPLPFTPEKLITAFEGNPALSGAQPLAHWKALEELGTISAAHLDPWIAALGRECRSVSPEYLAGLRMGLIGRLAQEKRLRQVSSDVDELLRFV